MGAKNVLPSPKRPDRFSGPPIPFSMGTEDFPGRGVQKVSKRPESEADHSPQCGMNAANVLLLQQAPSWPAPGNLTFSDTRRILCMPPYRTLRKNLGSEICFGVFATAVTLAVTSDVCFKCNTPTALVFCR